MFFNCARTHQVLPSITLLPYACDHERLCDHANAFARDRASNAEEAVRGEPELQGICACPVAAAMFQSSLVGTTTYQQGAVTNQLLKALVSNRDGKVLRPQVKL